MQKKNTIYDQFNHRYFVTLHANNKEEALKYLDYFNRKKKDEVIDRAMMVEKLKKHWIRIFPNYTIETVERKYNDLLLSLKGDNANDNTWNDLWSDIQ